MKEENKKRKMGEYNYIPGNRKMGEYNYIPGNRKPGEKRKEDNL